MVNTVDGRVVGIGDGDGNGEGRRSGIGGAGEREGKSVVGGKIFRICQKPGIGEGPRCLWGKL